MYSARTSRFINRRNKTNCSLLRFKQNCMYIVKEDLDFDSLLMLVLVVRGIGISDLNGKDQVWNCQTTNVFDKALYHK